MRAQSAERPLRHYRNRRLGQLDMQQATGTMAVQNKTRETSSSTVYDWRVMAEDYFWGADMEHFPCELE